MTADPTDRHNAPTHAHDVDQSIANLLEQMARELEDRGAVDVEALARAHPEHADRLRQLLPAMEAVAGWAERTASLSPGPRAPADVPEVGDTLQYFGDYELLEEIARGGMGVVYKARQTTLNRIVALKMILSGELAGEREVARFHAEAQAAARLDHPGIVPIFEVGQHNGRHYFSMGYVEGTSLADRVSQGPLDPREAAALIRKVTQAVAYAHNEGVVHRDLKPANVLLDARNEPRVTDFGLAKQVRGGSDLTATGQVLGTPAYMPPEQAGGAVERVDGRSDVYSMGAMLYCLLTGRPPFQAASPVDTLLQVLSTEAVAPRTLNPAVPADLETICLKCLEKDPRRRYQSANEVGEELERFLNHLPIQARPVRRVERAWRWCKRNRTVAALAAAVASLLIGIAIAGPLVAWRQSALRANAEEASEQERQQREKAEQLSETNRRQLVNMNVLQGDVLVDRNDPVGAMPWYTEALRLDKGDAEREAPHRLRLASTWQNVPKFTHLWRHKGAANRIAVSPDERYVATASDDYTTRVWDLTTGKPVTPPLTLSGSVHDCAFSRDGKLLATAGGVIGISGEIRIWDVATGKQVGQPILNPMATFFHVGFTDAGDILSVDTPITGEGRVQLRNSTTHAVMATKKFDPISPEFAMNTVLKPWHLKSGRILERDHFTGHVFDLAAKSRHVCDVKQDSQLLSATFSGDGSRVFTTTWHAFIVWDVATGRELGRYNGEQDGWNVYDFAAARACFSLDNQRVTVAGANGQVVTFDIKTKIGKSIRPIPNIYSARPFISENGRMVAMATRGGAVQIWDAWDRRPVVSPIKHTSSVVDVQFAADNRFVVTACSDGTVRVWDLSTGIGLSARQHENGLIGVDITDDDKEFVIFSNAHVRRFVRRSETQLSDFDCAAPGPNVTTKSTEHRLYARGSSGGIARVWNYATGKPVSPELKHERNDIRHVAISPNGKRLATIEIKSYSASDVFFGQANVWDIESGKRILGPLKFSELFSGVVNAQFSPDSRLLVLGGGGISLNGVGSELKIIDLETGREVEQSFERSPNVFIGNIAFDPGGRYLATTTGSPFVVGGELRIWDLKERRMLGSPLRFADNPTALEFDSQSRYLAVPVDNQVRVISLETGKLAIPSLIHDQTVGGVAFSDDNKWIVTSSNDNMVRIWDVATGRRMGPSFAHAAKVLNFKMTRDSELITACADNWVRVWAMRPSNQSFDGIGRMVRLLSTEEISASQLFTISTTAETDDELQQLLTENANAFKSSQWQKFLWHDIQTTDFWNRGEWLAAIPGYVEMEKFGACNHFAFGQVLCSSGQFDRGIKEFDKVIKQDAKNDSAWSHRAIAELQSGDTAAYKATCEKMLEQLGNAENWLATAHHIVMISLVGPSDFKDGSKPFELASRAATQNKVPVQAGDVALAKATADYRAGRFEEAEKGYTKVNANSPNWFLQSVANYGLAMTAWKSDKHDQARSRLKEADAFRESHRIDAGADGWFWRAIVDLAKRETEDLIVAEKTNEDGKADTSKPKE